MDDIPAGWSGCYDISGAYDNRICPEGDDDGNVSAAEGDDDGNVSAAGVVWDHDKRHQRR